MECQIINDLTGWKDFPVRMPLLLRGARQTGKTYVINNDFASQHFKHVININFELERPLLSCFENLNVENITTQLSAITKIPIIPIETLLFFDEIHHHVDALF